MRFPDEDTSPRTETGIGGWNQRPPPRGNGPEIAAGKRPSGMPS